MIVQNLTPRHCTTLPRRQTKRSQIRSTYDGFFFLYDKIHIHRLTIAPIETSLMLTTPLRLWLLPSTTLYSGFGASSSNANANAFNQYYGPNGFGASAANAGAQSFYNQGPGGGFGASAANSASQGFSAGPGGFSVSSNKRLFHWHTQSTVCIFLVGFSRAPLDSPVARATSFPATRTWTCRTVVDFPLPTASPAYRRAARSASRRSRLAAHNSAERRQQTRQHETSGQWLGIELSARERNLNVLAMEIKVSLRNNPWLKVSLKVHFPGGRSSFWGQAFHLCLQVAYFGLAFFFSFFASFLSHWDAFFAH